MFKLGTEEVNEEISKDLEEFVEKKIFKNEYLFFENKGNKQIAYCECGEYETKGLKHNKVIKCSKCRRKFIAKNIKLGRKNIYKNASLYWFEKANESKIIVKGYYVTKDFANWKESKIIYELQSIYIFKYGEKSKMYKFNWWTNEFEERASVFNFNIGWLANINCYVDYKNIKQVIERTDFKYMPKENYKDDYVNLNNIVVKIDEFARFPWLESLNKMGFKRIVTAKLNKQSVDNSLNTRGKNIFKILRLTKDKVKELQKYGADKVTSSLLRMYQLQAKDNSNLSVEEVNRLTNNYIRYSGNFKQLERILKVVKFKKVFNYFDKQVNKNEETFNRIYGYGAGSNILETYLDYLNMLKELNRDITDKDELFPKDLKNAHDKAVDELDIKRNQEIDLKISTRLSRLHKYKFEYKNLFIRPANSSLELIHEGKKLKHCVATYIKSYSEGKTNILFIRKKDDPYNSFYTVEVKGNKIIQVRGYRNKAETEEVKEFMDQFEKKILNKNKKVKIA